MLPATTHLGAAQHAVAIHIRPPEQLLGMVQHVRLVHRGCVAQCKDAAAAAIHSQVLVHMDCMAVLLEASDQHLDERSRLMVGHCVEMADRLS
jgi:hypothetical protein